MTGDVNERIEYTDTGNGSQQEIINFFLNKICMLIKTIPYKRKQDNGGS